MSLSLDTLNDVAKLLALSSTVEDLNTLSTFASVLPFNDAVRKANFLFQVLHISGAAELQEFHTLIKRSPNHPISQYALDVYIHVEHPSTDASLAIQSSEVLFSCTRAKILDLTGVILSLHNPRHFRDVTTVILCYVSFTEEKNVFNFLHCMPSLEVLAIGWMEYGSFSGNCDPLPQGLRSLSVTCASGQRNRRSDAFVKSLAHLPDIPHITHLNISNVNDASASDVVDLLALTKAHLESVELTIAYGHVQADETLRHYTQVHGFPVYLYEDANGVPSNQINTA